MLFEKSRPTINEHILNIFKEGELAEGYSIKKIGICDFAKKPTNFCYNICRLPCKVIKGIQFGQWLQND
ncbi:MAG: hypothetical protein IJ759_05120 [Bacteroidales bacterium]|nr:hypothetical protein [Bacteroidales bacterium]